MKNRKKRNIIIGALFCFIVFMGIGYAILSSKISIKGIGYMEGNWNIYISDMKLKSINGRAQEISSSYDKLSANFEVDLYMPGDFVEYDITVTNGGNLDGALKQIISTPVNSNEDIELSHSMEQGEKLSAGESKTFTLKIEFDKNAIEIPDTQSPINYKIELVYMYYSGNELYDPINTTTDNVCFSINDNGVITGYDFDCGTEVVVPEEIDGIKVKSVSSYMFYNEDVNAYSYSYVDVNGSSQEGYYYVAENQENYDKLLSYFEYEGSTEESLAENNIYLRVKSSFEEEQVDVTLAQYIGGYILKEGEFVENDTSSENDISYYQMYSTGEIYFIARNQEMADGFLEYSLLGTSKEGFKEYCDTEASNNGQTCDELVLEEANMNFEEYVEYILTTGKASLESEGMYIRVEGDSSIPNFTERKFLTDLVTLEGMFSFASDGSLNETESMLTKIDLSKATYLENVNFKNSVNLIEVKLPNTLKSISDYAFYNTKITSIDLPSNLETIGACAFKSLTLKKIFIPKNVKLIGEGAFYRAGISKVIFEEDSKLLTIDKDAFAYNKLDSLNLPKELVNINTGAFYSNQIAGRVTIPSNITSIANTTFANNKITSIVFDKNSHLKSLGVQFSKNPLEELIFESGSQLQTISAAAFNKNCSYNSYAKYSSLNLKKVVLPDTVQSIGDVAFCGNSIESLSLPRQLQTIGVQAFSNNSIGGTLVIPNKLESIGNSAFSTNKISSLKFEDNTSLVTIPEAAFSSNSIGGTLVIPNKIESIEKNAFYANKISSLKFEENSSLVTISGSAFYNNSIGGTLVIPNKIESIGNSAFSKNKISSLKFEENSSLVTISRYAFSNNSISGTLVIPDKVEEIGYGAFESNLLKELYIPGSVKSVGQAAFWGNYIDRLTVVSSQTKFACGVFNGANNTLSVLNLPEGVTKKDVAWTGCLW
ncbi:MAG: leucine-rich repeat protein [Bacilli bacterium]